MNHSQEDKWVDTLTAEQVASVGRLATGSDVVSATGIFLTSGLSCDTVSIETGTLSQEGGGLMAAGAKSADGSTLFILNDAPLRNRA